MALGWRRLVAGVGMLASVYWCRCGGVVTLASGLTRCVVASGRRRRTVAAGRLWPEATRIRKRLRFITELTTYNNVMLLGYITVLPCAEMQYAVGQGALAVECRAGDRALLALLAPFSHAGTYCRVLAERSFLKTLGGGCSAPVGVSTTLKPLDSQFQLSITGAVWSLDGSTKLDHTLKQTFVQIKRTQKHKLSPTEEQECNKKIKISDDSDETIPPDVVSNIISDKIGNCSDVNLNEEFHADERIFCGLTANVSVPIEVVIKCDNLGRDLANALIEKGALEVMKVTQDFIRSSTVAKTS